MPFDSETKQTIFPKDADGSYRILNTYSAGCWSEHTISNKGIIKLIRGVNKLGFFKTYYNDDGTEYLHENNDGIWKCYDLSPVTFRHNYHTESYMYNNKVMDKQQALNRFRSCSKINIPMILYWLLTGTKFSTNAHYRKIYKIIKTHLIKKI